MTTFKHAEKLINTTTPPILLQKYVIFNMDLKDGIF